MMNRNRRSVSKTPLQKTNLFHFFPRTPASSQPCQIPVTPQQGNVVASTPSSSIIDSSTTPYLTKAKRFAVCPACKKNVPYYSLNDHLDNDCVPASPNLRGSPQISDSNGERIIHLTVPEVENSTSVSPTTIKEEETANSQECNTGLTSHKKSRTPEKKLACSPKKLDFSSPSSSPALKTNRKYFSSSKKNRERRKEVAKEFQERLVQTDVKKQLSKNENDEDLSSVKKILFDDESKPSKYYGLPYYLETFLFLLKSTFDEPLHLPLFNEDDHRAYNTFKSLSLDAQKLYVRLFSRKFQWRRRGKIVYEDIAADLAPSLQELCSSSLLLGIDHLDDLSTLLHLLTQPELKQLFKEAKIPFNGKGNASVVLMKHCRDQPCLAGSKQSMADRITAKIKSQYIKECYKLNDEFRRTFLQLILLSTLHQRQEEEEEKGQQQQSFKMLQVKIGEKSYPPYVMRRQRAIFHQRDHFLKYGEAALLELQVRESYDNKQWEMLVDQTEPIAQLFSEYLENYRDDDLKLPIFLRRYTAGSVYVYTFNKRIEALQCLKRYEEAVDLIRMLIQQEVYLPTHRGHWYERLALNLEQHLKQPYEAFEMIKNALNDSWVSPAHRFCLSQRAVRMSQSARFKQKLEPLLTELPLLTAADPRCVVITGRSLPRDLPGVKSMFIRGDSQADMNDVTLCSVEELVLQHYIENGYTHGVHGEGSTLWTVIGLLFWDIIYQSDVADVFLSPFQALPLDFDTLDFYQTRRESIEKKLESIRNGSASDVIEEISRIWNANHGQTSLVSWDRFRDLEHIDGLVQCISPLVLAAISQRLLQNYRHYRSGFPDLTIWNPQEKKWRIIEVKGPNDRLSPKQTLWLDFLVSLGVEAEVCHVQAVGARRMGATPQVAVKSKSPRTIEEDNEHSNEKSGRKSRRIRAKLQVQP